MKTPAKIIGLALAAILMATPSGASASAETDEKVGLCVCYLILLQRPNAAQIALGQADNQQRAMQFARTQLNQIARWRDRGEWNDSTQRGFALKGESACRRIGVRPGDYSN